MVTELSRRRGDAIKYYKLECYFGIDRTHWVCLSADNVEQAKLFFFQRIKEKYPDFNHPLKDLDIRCREMEVTSID